MSRYVLRRLIQSAFTVMGVMLLTFILFRVIAGDVSVAYVNQKLGAEARQAFYEKHKLDRPPVLNFHRRIEVVDHTSGPHIFDAADRNGSNLADALNLHLSASAGEGDRKQLTMAGDRVFALSRDSELANATDEKPLVDSAATTDSTQPQLLLTVSDGTTLDVPLSGMRTVGDLLDGINSHTKNSDKVTATLSEWSPAKMFDSQFFWHLYENVTFSGRSYATDQTLLQIVAERARFSLALTIPAMALGWLIAMVISTFVAYYRGTWIDRFGVFLSVLGMCIPFLAYMLLGQYFMFKIAPRIAVGLSHPMSVYVPVLIAVVAGLGVSVRFYRTIILDEIGRDYVRTARAKGVPLPGVLFKHVLRNCMLPILTNLITTIPFLIMGSLLLERFFGIPGLGDLMLTSISSRDVPMITGLTFLTSVLYVVSLLVTDVLYAVFDPRIRLQ
ncbi:MAG: ABC transporter permease subunit [Chitinivibrionales bacterium]|nr:ABC transporter permease subunit [Chitinivibrionales bacterium]